MKLVILAISAILLLVGVDEYLDRRDSARLQELDKQYWELANDPKSLSFDPAVEEIRYLRMFAIDNEREAIRDRHPGWPRPQVASYPTMPR